MDKVPNSVPGRNNIEIEIYGMEGIPEEDAKEHERQKINNKGTVKPVLETTCINSLPNRKILDVIKLKAFADDKLNIC